MPLPSLLLSALFLYSLFIILLRVSSALRSSLHSFLSLHTLFSLLFSLFPSFLFHSFLPLPNRTALHFAARNGHLSVVQFLAENGGDLNARDRFVLTLPYFLLTMMPIPLFILPFASISILIPTPINTTVDTSFFLPQTGPPFTSLPGTDTFLSSNSWRRTAATSTPETLVLTLPYFLLTMMPIPLFILPFASISILIPTTHQHDDETALHFAARNGHLSVVQFLAENGGDLNARDCDVSHPLPPLSPLHLFCLSLLSALIFLPYIFSLSSFSLSFLCFLFLPSSLYSFTFFLLSLFFLFFLHQSLSLFPFFLFFFLFLTPFFSYSFPHFLLSYFLLFFFNPFSSFFSVSSALRSFLHSFIPLHSLLPTVILSLSLLFFSIPSSSFLVLTLPYFLLTMMPIPFSSSLSLPFPPHSHTHQHDG
ncbi:hypothetical protein C7M84_001640 [Penaeus vannamei]|uniref:Uncharacterized protein n=1 Tax=Penaeus vannamei TaxID=6689 RepID=A0A423TT40_PENVA|nr:hypothetical protein C7M84_001640 [Penaeus vannamei]